MQNCSFLVAKILSKIDVFLARFLEGYLNIDRAAGGAAGSAASGVLSAADAPGERHFIKDYSIITHQKHQNTFWTLEMLEIVRDLTRPGPLARRILY